MLPSPSTLGSTDPLVTIVTATCNQADFLPDTVESVLSQSYPAIEYIVLDDGSTDHTRQVLEYFTGRLTWSRHENMGQARTLNKGWNSAQGKYIGYLSSDDILMPDCVSSAVRALEANPDVVCAFPEFDLIDPEGKIVKKKVARPFSLEEIVVGQSSYVGPGALFRKDAFNLIGGWRTDLKLGPDREFWIRLASEGQFHFVEESLARYRIHPESITVKETSEEISQEFIRVLDLYFSTDPAPECVNRKDEAYARATLVLCRNALRSGRLQAGLAHYREVCRLYPPLAGLDTKAELLRTVISKPLRLAMYRVRSLVRKSS